MWASALGPTDLAVWSGKSGRIFLIKYASWRSKTSTQAPPLSALSLQVEGMLTLVTLAEIRPRFQREVGTNRTRKTHAQAEAPQERLSFS